MFPKLRTAGDGMESDSKLDLETTKHAKSAPKQSVHPGRLVQIFPTITTLGERKPSKLYSKSPKFVPYEPYTAAVKPIVPLKHVQVIKKSKNNLDLNTLVSQMSQMDTNLNEFKPRVKAIPVSDSSLKESEKNTPEMSEMQKKIEQLTTDNLILKEQLEQQVQVNKELKTMLVASMGEDLEVQVQSLNDDKKHLADALINSAQHLSTHQEQTEWLAGQCEVWRSKFLASSLMVEELANWKKVLNERTIELQQVITQLLDDRYRARDMMLCTFKNLYYLHDDWLRDTILSEERKTYTQSIGNLHLNATKLSTTNILDLASVNLKLSENLSSSMDKPDVKVLEEMTTLTPAEKLAEDLLTRPLELKRVNDEPVKALVHCAHSCSGPAAPTTSVAACQHCNGKVRLL